MMKAVAVVEPGEVETVEIPRPSIEKHECLVKIVSSGLCNSTDLKIIDGELSDMTVPFPVILGHEGVGEVVEVGSRVLNWQIGERMLNPIGRTAPGTPYQRMWANMVEYAVVQDRAVMRELGMDAPGIAHYERKLPGGLDGVDCGVLLTLMEILSGVRNFGIAEEANVLVYGDGPVGLGLCQFSKHEGAEWVACVGHHDDRLRRVGDLGHADMLINSREVEVAEAVGDRRFDLVIDAVGSVDIIIEGAKFLEPGGKVGAYGVMKKKYADVNLLDLPNHAVVHLLNFPHGQFEVQDEVARMILDGQVNPKDYYSHVMPYEQAAEAVEMIRKREAFKIVFGGKTSDASEYGEYGGQGFTSDCAEKPRNSPDGLDYERRNALDTSRL